MASICTNPIGQANGMGKSSASRGRGYSDFCLSPISPTILRLLAITPRLDAISFNNVMSNELIRARISSGSPGAARDGPDSGVNSLVRCESSG